MKNILLLNCKVRKNAMSSLIASNSTNASTLIKICTYRKRHNSDHGAELTVSYFIQTFKYEPFEIRFGSVQFELIGLECSSCQIAFSNFIKHSEWDLKNTFLNIQS